MDFKLKRTENKVNEFSYIDKTVFLIKNNDELFVADKLIYQGELSFFGIYNKLQIIFDEDNFNSLLFDINGNLKLKIQEYALRHIYTFSNGNSLVGGNDGKNVFYGIYNFPQKKMLKHFENIGFNGIHQVINDDLFLSKNKEKFGVFTFDNVCVWERNYKELYSDYCLTGGVDILKGVDKLYVGLDKTYCIDIETGKNKQVYDYHFSYSENEFLYGLQFLSMTEFHLAILNTKTNTLKVIDVSNEFNKLNIYPDRRIVVNKGLVYFSQNMGTNVAKIGVLDPASEKILWKHDFEKKNGMIGTLKINGNRIYAHTQDRTLHIFEKTENINI